MSRSLSYHLGKKGQLNIPGITAASKKATEELLLKDAEKHHCFFRSAGLHNHLSHHILAAYDLGAPPGHLKKIYEEEAKTQRPRILEEKDKSIIVNKENWVQYLGNQSAYSAFVQFYSEEVASLGTTGTLEKYVFSEEANEHGKNMLARVMGGAVHPFIQIGYGAEFGNDTLIATGLAQASMHTPITGSIFKIDKSQPSKTVSLLGLLRRVYDSEVLKPALPYDPDALVNARMKNVLTNGGTEEIEKLSAEYHISDNITDAELEKKVEECIFVATLLMSATGRKGRKPRLDFFLMHLVTSSLFLRPWCAILEKSEHKAALIRAYVPVLVLITLARGRPRIDPSLLMSYSDVPRAPVTTGEQLKPTSTALGSPLDNEDYNPWPTMIEGVRYHSDSHVLKTLRTLAYGAQHYGDVPAGNVIGAFSDADGKEETHIGIAKVDGTVFVRAAGVMMDTMGWLGHGQKEGQWDRSALGWNAAWDSGD